MKTLIASFAVVVLGAAGCLAGPKTVPGKDKMVAPPVYLFNPNEYVIGIFASWDVGRVDYHKEQVTHIVRETSGINPQRFQTSTTTENHYVHNAVDAGVEADYFFTRYLGLGLEGDWICGNDVINAVSASFIARYPIEYGRWGWAPYAMIGGGGQFDGVNAGTGHIGGGAEIRFRQHWGVFADGRWVIHDSTINYGLFRLGVRYNF